MSAIEIKFSHKTLSSLPLPSGSVQEYKDPSCPTLRILKYKNKTTFIFKTSHQYTAIRETLGHFPILSLSDAKTMVQDRLQDLNNNLYVFNKNITVKDVINTIYIDDMKTYKRNTGSELSKINKYVLPIYGNHKLINITKASLNRYFQSLLNTLAPATVNRIISIFKKIFSLAIENDLIKASPLDHIRFFPENNYRHNILDEEQMVIFSKCCLNNGSIPAMSLYLSLNTGMRISEVISLKLSNIDFKRNVIILGMTKNNLQHIIPLNTTLIDTLKAYIKKYDINGYLFPSNTSSTGYISYPRYIFNSIKRRMNVPDLRIHDLRRSYANMILNKKGDIALVSQLLNHRSISTTQRYAFYNIEQLKTKVFN